MAGETILTVVGNLAADPDLRFTQGGDAVANFTVMSTPRSFDKQSGEWRDGQALAIRCSVWRQAAENVSESLTRGMRVIVQGRLKAQKYEKDGETRYAQQLEVDEVGPALKFAKASVTKASGGGNGGGYGGGQDDPWSSAPSSGPVGGGGAYDDEPPF